jgi:hypothetical protein
MSLLLAADLNVASSQEGEIEGSRLCGPTDHNHNSPEHVARPFAVSAARTLTNVCHMAQK